MDEILVSVVMPAHNAEKYIRGAIESVFAQQGDFQIELFVIDDASEDRTEKIVKDCMQSQREKQAENAIFEKKVLPELIYLKNEHNLGVAETRNRGIREASGAYIAFLDADDWWMPEKLACQLKLMEKKHAVLSATARELMQPGGASTGKIIAIPEEITYQMLLRTNSIPCSSVLMKTGVAREFYMSHDELHEDYILWLKVLKKYGKAYGIDEPLLKCRLSEGGKSRNKIKSAKMQFGVYRYMGFGVVKSIYYFVQYAVNGFRKYRGSRSGNVVENE